MTYIFKRITNSDDPVIVKPCLAKKLDPNRVYELYFKDQSTDRFIFTQLEDFNPSNKIGKYIYFKRIKLTSRNSHVRAEETNLSSQDLIIHLRDYLTVIKNANLMKDETIMKDRVDTLVIRLSDEIHFPGTDEQVIRKSQNYFTQDFSGLLVLKINQKKNEQQIQIQLTKATLYIPDLGEEKNERRDKIHQTIEEGLKTSLKDQINIKLDYIRHKRLSRDDLLLDISYYSYLALTELGKLDSGENLTTGFKLFQEKLQPIKASSNNDKTIVIRHETSNYSKKVDFSENKIEGIKNEMFLLTSTTGDPSNGDPTSGDTTSETTALVKAPSVDPKKEASAKSQEKSDGFSKLPQLYPLQGAATNTTGVTKPQKTSHSASAATAYQNPSSKGYSEGVKITAEAVLQKQKQTKELNQGFLFHFRGQIIYLALLLSLAILLGLLIFFLPPTSPILGLLGASGLIASILNITTFTLGLPLGLYALLAGSALLVMGILLLGFYQAIASTGDSLNNYLYLDTNPTISNTATSQQESLNQGAKSHLLLANHSTVISPLTATQAKEKKEQIADSPRQGQNTI